jgi:hypothetical protein
MVKLHHVKMNGKRFNYVIQRTRVEEDFISSVVFTEKNPSGIDAINLLEEVYHHGIEVEPLTEFAAF